MAKDDFLQSLVHWIQSQDNIRGALLTSSRGGISTLQDNLSDYDVELYVQDISIIRKDDQWLDDLGPILLRWPRLPESTGDNRWVSRLIVLKTQVRLDLQITDQLDAVSANLNSGYKILVDKDDFLNELPQANPEVFNIKKPTREEFLDVVNDFFWDAHYVPKYLRRDELPFAKFMMSHDVQDRLYIMLEWYIGLKHQWKVNTGVQGRFFKKYLPEDLWQRFCRTFTGPEIDHSWRAFYIAVDLFKELAVELGEELGYPFSIEWAEEAGDYFKYIEKIEL